MKFSALIAAVAADWNGVSEDNSCGSQISADSMVNSTCTVSGSNIKHVFAGNGAFITGENTFTGFEDISGDVEVIVFFEQQCNGDCDNSTCWDATVNCVENESASAGVFFMESVNDHRGAKSGNFNLQIAGVSAGDSLAIALKNTDGGDFAVQNITVPFGTTSGSSSDNGIFNVQVGDEPFGDLFQVSVTAQDTAGILNLWRSTVEA